MKLPDRPRRLRQSETLRDLVSENFLSPHHLVQPLFIKEGITHKTPIASMPGIFQFSISEAVQEAKELWTREIKTVLLFGVPARKDAQASSACDPNGIIPEAIRSLKQALPDMTVIADVCLCEYMDHGHCGKVDSKGRVLNDPSVEMLAKTALTYAASGADMVAPSDMMDGRIGFIRNALDQEGFYDLPIMSYAVKYASSFYGPFREAAGSTPKFGDRKTYQMDPRNLKEALREAKLDEEEGADILLVKPALPSLDVIHALSQNTHLPIAAYQVSGEYAMIVAAAEKGWLDRKSIILESLTSIKRAGARILISYFAKEAAEIL